MSVAQQSRCYQLIQAHQHFILWIYCRQTGGRRSVTARLTWEEAEAADVCGEMSSPVLQPPAHRTDFVARSQAVGIAGVLEEGEENAVFDFCGLHSAQGVFKEKVLRL